MRPSRSMTCNGSFSASRDWGTPLPPVPTGGWGAPPPPKTCEIDEASRSRSPAELHTTRSAVPSGAVTESLVGSIACASTWVGLGVGLGLGLGVGLWLGVGVGVGVWVGVGVRVRLGLGLDRVRLDRGGGQQRQRALCTPARLRRRVEPDEQIAVELEPG